MSKSIITQKKIILEALKDGQDITAYEALKLCGSLRLSAQYHLINEEGETK